MDGWKDGWESGVKDCLQQSKNFKGRFRERIGIKYLSKLRYVIYEQPQRRYWFFSDMLYPYEIHNKNSIILSETLLQRIVSLRQ